MSKANLVGITGGKAIRERKQKKVAAIRNASEKALEHGKNYGSPSPLSSSPKKGFSLKTSDAEAAYPIGEFLVPAADGNGHSVAVATRVPPQMKRLIDMVLSTHEFPFHTSADVVRYCIREGLTALGKRSKKKEIPTFYAQLRSWCSIAESQNEHLYYERMLHGLKKSVDDMVASGNVPAARKLLRQVAVDVKNIDEPYWGPKFEKELLRNYDHLLRVEKEERGESDKPKRRRAVDLRQGEEE
jgi:hypothetical protein